MSQHLEPTTVFDVLVRTLEARDIDAMADLYDPDAVLHHPLAPEPVRGRSAILDAERTLVAAFADVAVERRSVLADGSTVTAEVVLAATNTGPIELGPDERLPATGRRIEIPCVWVLETSGGRIVDERDYFDTAELFRQLGLQ